MLVDQAIISATDLARSYGNVHALSGVDLQVAPGNVLALLGPNGAGKTTTVRILSTLLKPDRGQASIGGYDVVREPGKVQGLIGLAGQSASVDEKLTGTQNLAMFGRLHRLRTKDAKSRAGELIEQFGLAEAANRPVRTYSGGMRRKLDLAASLIMTPAVLFLDEPTAGLDPISRTTLWANIRQLVRDGTTVLLTTQYLEEADQLADTVAVIDTGRVIATGTPAQLKARLEATRFEVTASADADFTALRALSPNLVSKADRETRTVGFRADDAGLDGLRGLHTLIDAVLAADIAIVRYALREPTLDDAFLHLTGHGGILGAPGGPETN
jgi:ABC-2 type transport system ATP-binding protein